MNWIEIIIYGIAGALAIAVGVIVIIGICQFVTWLYTLAFYNFGYTELKTCKGKVTDMDYTPRRVRSTGKTTYTVPEKNEVAIDTPRVQKIIDSDRLYQRVRVGEPIVLNYQDVYLKPRFWEGEWTGYDLRIISIETKFNDTVLFNNEKPVTNVSNDQRRKRVY